MITQVKIENFYCLQNVQVTLKDFNVLVGMNDSGKSSFLEVFEILHKSTHEATDQMFPDRLRKHIWQQDIEKEIGIAVEWDKNISYQIALKEIGQYIRIIKEHLVIDDKQVIISLPKKSQGGQEISLLNQVINGNIIITGLEGNVLKKMQDTLAFLNNIKKYSFTPDRLRQPTPARKIEDTFDSDGLGLPSYLAVLKLEEDERFFQIVRALQAVIPRIKTINIAQVGPQNLYELSFTDINTGIKIPASVCSDGVLLFLAYLTLLYSPTPPSLILIENPENNIYPHYLESIVSYLKRLSQTQINGQTPQIIVTTHSPYLLDYVEAGEVLVFYRHEKDGTTVVKRLSEIPNFEAKKKDLLLGELWTTLGEEALMETGKALISNNL